MKPSPLQRNIFAHVHDDKGPLVIEAVAGCLSGNTIIGVHRAGKGFKLSLKDLVHRFNGGKAGGKIWNPKIPTLIRAPQREDGTVRLHAISQAVYSGTKEVYDLVLTKHKVRGTACHKILTPSGWVPIDQLRAGDEVVVEASHLGPGQGKSLKRNYLSRVVPYHPNAVHRGRGNLSVPTHRLNIEAHMNNMDLEAFVWRLQTSSDIKNLKFLDPNTHVHHKDNNTQNNGLDNLEVLSREEHLKTHEDLIIRNIQTYLITEKVVEVKYVGLEETYDLTVPGVDAFMANGIAVHNSGKSTVLLGITKIHKGPGILLAFNVDIAKALTAKLGSVKYNNMGVWDEGWGAKTISATGLAVLKYHYPEVSVETSRLYELMKPWSKGLSYEYKRKRKVLAEIRKLVSLMRGSLVDVENDEVLWEIMEHHGFIYPDLVLRNARDFYYRLIDQFTKLRIIDFDDMLFLPLHLDLDFGPWKFKKVLVDECQDLNIAQVKFVKKLLTEDGQPVFVGDRKQSIYGFRGADHNAFQNIIDSTQATTLPLSICYRCDKAIVERAKKIVPQIEAREDAGEGEDLNIRYSDLHLFAQKGDLVLCRTNAPLMGGCVSLLKKGIKARIKGKKFGEELSNHLADIGGKEGPFKAITLKALIEAKFRQDRERLIENEVSEAAILALEDTKEVLLLCVDLFPLATRMETLQANVKRLFEDTDQEYLWFSSVHKAKGLEANRVFIIEPTKMPLRFKNQQEWERDQEMNLIYVAITRAKHTLVTVHNDEDRPSGLYNEEFLNSDLFKNLVVSKGLSHPKLASYLLENPKSNLTFALETQGVEEESPLEKLAPTPEPPPPPILLSEGRGEPPEPGIDY